MQRYIESCIQLSFQVSNTFKEYKAGASNAIFSLSL